MCAVRIQSDQQNVNQDREYRNESSHKEQDRLDKHYEHREH
jgi:hypothetical protein